MGSELTKRSKATYYKHRLDKAVDILKDVKEFEELFDTWGVESLFDFQDKMRIIFEDIDQLMEDIDDE